MNMLLEMGVTQSPVKQIRSLELVEEQIYRIRQFSCESTKAIQVNKNVNIKIVITNNEAEIEV